MSTEHHVIAQIQPTWRYEAWTSHARALSLSVCLLVAATLLGAGCSRESNRQPVLPSTQVAIDLPDGWEVRATTSTDSIIAPRFSEYWLAGFPPNFTVLSPSGPAAGLFGGCVIGRAGNQRVVTVSDWISTQSFYSEETQLFVEGSRRFGESTSTDIVVTESGPNATRMETIFIRHDTSTIFGISYFLGVDINNEDRALLPRIREGCARIAQSLRIR